MFVRSYIQFNFIRLTRFNIVLHYFERIKKERMKKA